MADSLTSGDLATKLSALVPGGFFAPVSIQLALALVGAGATGETLSQLQSALGWPATPTWQQDFAKLLEGLGMAVAAGEPLLAVANRVYTNTSIKAEYAQAVQACFGASIEPLLSASQVNGFVSQETRGMIPEIVSETLVAQAALIAVSALYFKGKWATSFEVEQTQAAPFFTTTPSVQSVCHLMQTPRSTKWQYYEDETAQYILLPYRDAAGRASPLVALVSLPHAGTAPITNALSAVDWRLALQELRRRPPKQGTLWLPRFEAESETRLSDALKALGARRAFEPGAEFGNVTDDPRGIFISEVIHKVKVQVDEEGTVAAAATAVVMGFGCSAADLPFQMRCDRPFAFAIVAMMPMSPSASLVLFAGTVTDPGVVGPAPQAAAAPESASAARLRQKQKTAEHAPFTLRPNPYGPAAPPATAIAPGASITSQLTLEQRRQQVCLFNAACRRDVYKVLCAEPRRPLGPPSAPNGPPPALGAPTLSAPPPYPPLQWVLVQPHSPFTPQTATSLTRLHDLADAEIRAAAIQATLSALEHVGQPTDAGMAFTEAFERLLMSEYVPWWDDAGTSQLSAAFILAFGNELSPRLDIHHALRYRALPQEQVEWLRRLPPTIEFSRELIDKFQRDA